VRHLQPSYIPWRGYFHQIHKAALFVFHDSTLPGASRHELVSDLRQLSARLSAG